MPDLTDQMRRKYTDRISEILGKKFYGKIDLVTDTTNQMNIYRGHVVQLDDREFFVMGDVFEPRFGLEDQPKYWVKKTYDLADGQIRLLKLVFYEEFMAHVGPIRIRCFRSPTKESRVLQQVKNDDRFMQGTTIRDAVGNEVRVIDFIHGPTLYDYIFDVKEDHEEYFHNGAIKLIQMLIPSMEAISMLHEMDLCHGDIRNDHLIIDKKTGRFKWIDFDLSQHYPDFDVWSMGNVIAYIIGKGMVSFHDIENDDRFDGKISGNLDPKSDASAFFPYRIMNLAKVYPYIPKKINDILMHFSSGTEIFYESINHIVEDLGDALASWQH